MQNQIWEDCKKFLETKCKDNLFSIAQINNCIECNSNKCKHTAKLHLDELKKLIGSIRDEFSKWLQQNKKIVTGDPLKLDFKVITEILRMANFNLHEIVNDDSFNDYITWVQDIIHNYINFDALISSKPNDNEFFGDVSCFAEQILKVNFNHDNKRKLSFSLIKILIDSVRHKKISGFKNIERLSARVIRQVLLCGRITTLDDFRALMNFLHEELNIKDGSLNAKAIKWISDAIFFKYPVKASGCFDLLRLQNKNNLSPRELLDFIDEVVTLGSCIPDDHDDANKFITKELNKLEKSERNKFISENGLSMENNDKLYKPEYKYAYLSILQNLARLEFNEITDLLSFGKNYTLPDSQTKKYSREVDAFFSILYQLFLFSKEKIDVVFVQKIFDYINTEMKIKLPEKIDEYSLGTKLKEMLIEKCGGIVFFVSDDGCLKTDTTFDDFVNYKLHEPFFTLQYKTASKKVYKKQYADELKKLIKTVRNEYLSLHLDKNIDHKNQLKFDVKTFTEILKQSYWSSYLTEYNNFEDYFKWVHDVIKNDILFPENVTEKTKKDIADFLEAVTEDVDIKDHDIEISRLKLKSGILDAINKVTKLGFSMKDFVSSNNFRNIGYLINGKNFDDIKFLFEFIKNNQIDISFEELNKLLERCILFSAGKCFDELSDYDFQSSAQKATSAQKAIEYVKCTLDTFEQNMAEMIKSLIQKYKDEQKENNAAELDLKQIFKFVDDKMLKALGLKVSIDENGHIEMQKDLSVIESYWLNKKNWNMYEKGGLYVYYKAVKCVLMLNGKEGLKYFVQKYPYEEDNCFLKLSSEQSKQTFINAAVEIFFEVADSKSNHTEYSLNEVFDSVQYLATHDYYIDHTRERNMISKMLKKYYSNDVQSSEKCDENVKKRLCCWIENFWIFDIEAQTKILDSMLKAKDGILKPDDLEEIDLFLIKHFVFGLKPEENFLTKPKDEIRKIPSNVGIMVNRAIGNDLRKVVSGVVHILANAKENKKNNKLEITVEDLFFAARVIEDFYHKDGSEIDNKGKQIFQNIINLYFGDEITKLCEKIRAGQIDETVLKRLTDRYSKILNSLADARRFYGTEIVSENYLQNKRGFIKNKLLGAITFLVENSMCKHLNNLDIIGLKETIVSCFKLFFMLNRILSEEELKLERTNTVRTVYFKLVEIIKKDVDKYCGQIISDSTGEYDLQKIIGSYCDVSKTFSEAAKMPEHDAEETRKNICNAIKNTSINFIENDLKRVCEQVKSGQLDQANLKNIQNKYCGMIDTLYTNDAIIVDKKKKSIESTIEQLKNIAIKQSENREKPKVIDLKNQNTMEDKAELDKNIVNKLENTPSGAQEKTSQRLEGSKAPNLTNESEVIAPINNKIVDKPKDVLTGPRKETQDSASFDNADVDNKTNDLVSRIRGDITSVYYENEYHELERFDVQEKYSEYMELLNAPKTLGKATEPKYVDLKERLDDAFKVNTVFVGLYWIGQVFAFICPGFNSKNALAGIKNPRKKIIFDRLYCSFGPGINCLSRQDSVPDKRPIITKSGDNRKQPSLEEDLSDVRH